MRPFPGRWNVTLRCVLSCAICIVTSMALQVPFLGVISIFVVFYATQSNIVMARLVGLVLFIGITLAMGLAIVLLKFTFEYPLLRILVSMGLIFVGLFLMRATKLGPVFYLIALVITTSQSFFDMSPSADVLVRALLWALVAAIYPLAVSVLINTLLMPGEPLRQLKDEAHRQMRQLDAILAHAEGRGPPAAELKLEDIQQGALAAQKLLRFAWMRDKIFERNRARHLAISAAVSALREQATRLQRDSESRPSPAALASVRAACRRLDERIEDESPFTLEGIEAPPATEDSPTRAMWQVLTALAERSEVPLPAPEKKHFFLPDAFSNPVYVQFALKTVLAIAIGYLFYTATDWSGIKTVMVTCLIVAQPSLGASNHKIHLRIVGAALGGAVALFLTVFVVPRLDGIVGLLLISLPVFGLASWISAGSERIAYAGLQLMYTFALVTYGVFTFGPVTDLSKISDRLIGIGLGIALSYVIHTLLWPERESKPLAQKLGALMKSIAKLIARPAERGGVLARPAQASALWAEFNDCEETLSNVAFEPSWQQGEGEHENVTLHAQALIAHAREILLAVSTFGASIDASADTLTPTQRQALTATQTRIAERLAHYGEALIDSGDVLCTAPPPSGGEDAPRTSIAPGDESLDVRRELGDLAAAVNGLLAATQTGDNPPATTLVPA